MIILPCSYAQYKYEIIIIKLQYTISPQYLSANYQNAEFLTFPEKLELLETDPEKYYYLNRTGGVYDIPDADDTEEFHLTMVREDNSINPKLFNNYVIIHRNEAQWPSFT